MAIRPLHLVFVGMLAWGPAAHAAETPEEAYAYIAGLAEKGLDEMVVKSAREFLRKNPEHPRAIHVRYRLGSACLALGDATAAAEALAVPAASREFEFAAEANLRLGRSKLMLGDARGAAECAERARALGREYMTPLARALAAEAHSALGDWPAARSDYDAWLAVEKDRERIAEARLGKAWVTLRAGDPRAAEKTVFDLADADQLSAAREGEALVLIGECALDDARPKDALERLREVRDPNWVDAAARGRGFALAALGDHAGAAVEFHRVAEQTKSRFAAECALHEGIELLAAGDARAARAALSASVVPATAEASFWRARAELESDDARAALATLDAALKSAPEGKWKDSLQTARGSALEKLGRASEAADAFARSGSVDGLQAAAVADLAAQRFDSAARTARRALELAPPPEKAARAWVTVGEAERGAKHFDRAEEAFTQAARVEPDTARAARARLRAAWCRYEAGDAAGARLQFEAAGSGGLPPDEAAEAHFMRARCLEAAGDRTAASHAFAEHAQRFAGGERALEALVRAARNGGDVVEQLGRVVDAGAAGAWADEGRFELAERASAAARFDVGARRYQEVLAHTSDPKLAARARYGAAWCAFSLGRFAECASALETLLGAPDLEPAVRSAALELDVFARVREGNATAAAAALRAFARDAAAAPKLGALTRQVIDLLRTKSDGQDATALLDELERSAPATAKAGFAALRARAAVDAGRLDEAESKLRPWLERSDLDAAARASIADAAFALAEALGADGDLERVLALYAAAARDPELADRALYKSGFVALKRGDAARAERDLGKLVEAHAQSPLVPESLFLRGEALQRLDRHDEAIPLLERVVRSWPRHAVAPKAAFRLGQCHARAEHWQRALDTFDALLASTPAFPNRAEVDLDRGRALSALGDTRGARAAFDRAIAAGAGATADRARLAIGRLLAQGGDREGSLEQYLKVALLSNDAECVPEALFAAGETLETLGQPARAADRYREITASHAQSPWAARAKAKLAQLETQPAPPRRRRA